MNIYESLASVMADCRAVGKNDKNPNQGYKYRGIDAVMNAVNPALVKNKVFAVPEVIEMTREERQNKQGGVLIYSIAKVKYTFFAEDGSSVYATVIGEGMDSGDKSMNKAMSAAFKYALFQVLCIPTEEMIDSESDSPEPKAKEEVFIEEKITDLMFNTIVKLADEKGIDHQTICNRYGVSTIKDIPAKCYTGLMNGLKKS